MPINFHINISNYSSFILIFIFMNIDLIVFRDGDVHTVSIQNYRVHRLVSVIIIILFFIHFFVFLFFALHFTLFEAEAPWLQNSSDADGRDSIRECGQSLFPRRVRRSTLLTFNIRKRVGDNIADSSGFVSSCCFFLFVFWSLFVSSFQSSAIANEF